MNLFETNIFESYISAMRKIFG